MTLDVSEDVERGEAISLYKLKFQLFFDDYSVLYREESNNDKLDNFFIWLNIA